MSESSIYPSPDEILEREIRKARECYPKHAGNETLTDAHLLAFALSSLARVADERAKELRSMFRPTPEQQRRMRLSWPVMAESMGLSQEQAQAVVKLAEAARLARLPD